MKRFLLVCLMFFAVAALLMGTAPDANALFVLTLDDLEIDGIEVIVVDNEPEGTPTNKGLSNNVDQNPMPGVVVFSGSVGTFSVTVTTGISEPVIGSLDQARLHLNSVNVSGVAVGTLEIMLTDTDFLLGGQPRSATFTSGIGGTTDGTVEFEQILDRNNNEFGIDGLVPPDPDLPPDIVSVAQGPFSGGVFAGEETELVVLGEGEFSLTEKVRITHAADGDITSFDALSTVAPAECAIDEDCDDDGLFCTGEEICDPAAGCVSTGDPCPAGTVCNEDTDTCDVVNGKVTLCHKGKNTITVGAAAVPAHLRHGDTLGPCQLKRKRSR